MNEVLLRIAKKHFGVKTLDPRGRDRLDFREISVGQMKAALEEAYRAGATDQLEIHNFQNLRNETHPADGTVFSVSKDDKSHPADGM